MPVEIVKLREHIHRLSDGEGSTAYLVTGSKKALLIDTLFESIDLKKVITSMTDLPVVIVNTHGHIDHICGNASFDQPAYIHKDDQKIAEFFYADEDMQEVFRQYHRESLEWKYIEPGEIIDLGDVELEVISLSGHTPGSIGLLEKKEKILFSGDATCGHLWMQLPESLKLEKLYETYCQLEKRRDEFDYILSGHTKDLEDVSVFDITKAAVKEILDGKTEGDIPYQYFGGTCKAHPYADNTRLIVYNE